MMHYLPIHTTTVMLRLLLLILILLLLLLLLLLIFPYCLQCHTNCFDCHSCCHISVLILLLTAYMYCGTWLFPSWDARYKPVPVLCLWRALGSVAALVALGGA